MDIKIGRYNSVFGPQGTWDGGREKAPAAFCRKIAMLGENNQLEVLGGGKQTRSFLYVDECVTATIKLMRSNVRVALNIGSEEMVTLNQLGKIVLKIAGKKAEFNHIAGSLGVMGRNSDNQLIQEQLGWAPSEPLAEGSVKTYEWISEQVQAKSASKTGPPFNRDLEINPPEKSY